MSTQKKAVLVISFGTSHHDTCQKNIAAIEEDLAVAFPGWEVRRAFTSGMIIRKLAARDNLYIDTVPQALERLAREGFDTVICQPTHVINGVEYTDILRDAQPYRRRFSYFSIGAPLLTCARDYQNLAAAIGAQYPLDDGQALCLMGHGSNHFADSAYAALEYHLHMQGLRNVFVATVEGYPDLDALLRQLQRYGAKQLVLAPLMVVAGDHAVNDMASDEPDSWKSILQHVGYSVTCILKGLGEFPAVRALYVEHAKAVQPNGYADMEWMADDC